jgi:predicted SAM-dependent methyltransferase
MIKKVIHKVIRIYIKILHPVWLRKYLFVKYIDNFSQINLIIGAGGTNYEGWIASDFDYFDITSKNDWNIFFTSKNKKFNRLLAEHVIEHIEQEKVELLLMLASKNAKAGSTFRIAVPDGFFPNEKYIASVIPGGNGPGALDHKALYNYKTLTKVINRCNLKCRLIEYYDEDANFHSVYDDNNGYIRRCLVNDKRNTNGDIKYTSLITDVVF